ncbi:MAG: hypothetical protein AB8B94_03930 [Hyphomicrobiales bacterium]
MNPAELHALLSKFDGRTTTSLTDIEVAHGHEDGYVNSLIFLIGNGETNQSDGATWLIKAWLEQNKPFSKAQSDQLIERLPLIDCWQSQLHICQSIKNLTISASEASHVCEWLHGLLRHEKPFLRAWSLNALIVISNTHKVFQI